VTIFLLLLLVVATALNIVATLCLIRSDVYSASQKTLQAMLAWLVPLIGAILVLSVWAHNRKRASRDPVRHDEGPWLPGMGPESDRVHHGDGFGGSSHDGHGGDGAGSGD
jgi:hypothetical protein